MTERPIPRGIYIPSEQGEYCVNLDKSHVTLGNGRKRVVWPFVAFPGGVTIWPNGPPSDEYVQSYVEGRVARMSREFRPRLPTLKPLHLPWETFWHRCKSEYDKALERVQTSQA